MSLQSLRHVAVLLLFGFFAASAAAAELAVPCNGDPAVQTTSGKTTTENDRSHWRYPFEARRQRAEGTVRLEVQLDRDGKASNVKLAASSGSSTLDRAALKAAKGERFCKLDAPSVAMQGVAVVSVSYSLHLAVARL